ncbi:MAG: T9SS type A sorting domain-containing protein [bacterium]
MSSGGDVVIKWEFDFLKPGETKRIKLKVLVEPDIEGSSTLLNEAKVEAYDFRWEGNLYQDEDTYKTHVLKDEIDLWVIIKKGPDKVLPGTIIRYTICYGNSSNVDLRDILIIDTLPPGVGYSWHTEPDSFVWKEGNKYIWEISELPAGISKSFKLGCYVSSKVAASTTLTNKVEIKSKHIIPGVVDIMPNNNTDTWQTHVEEEPEPDLFVKVKASKQRLRPGEGKSVTIFYGNKGTGVAEDVELDYWCGGRIIGPEDTIFLGDLQPGQTGKLSYDVRADNLQENGVGYESADIYCENEEKDESNNYRRFGEQIALSTDPNDKLSSPQDFISHGEEITYTIRFENVATATIPAQYITIEDSLPAELDWGTFFPGRVSIGTATYDSIEAFNASGRGSLTLTYNPSTGKIRYKFDLGDDYGTTGLKPNQNPPEGEGWVEFTIDTIATLTTGTKITNTATIQFDWNEWMETPAATNIVDLTPPTSTVKPLPAISTSTTFLVEWEGQDLAGVEQGRMREYNVYVSDNNGTPTLWQTVDVWDSLSPTFAGSAQFKGEYGHSYGFYSQAMDVRGNLQSTPSTPQASIKLIAENIEIKASGKIAMEVDGSVTLSCLAKGTDSSVLATWTLTGDIGSLSATSGTETTFEAKAIGKGIITAFDGTSTAQIPIVVGECVDEIRTWTGTLTATWGTATARFGTSSREVYLIPIGTVSSAILQSLAGNIGIGMKINAYGTSATEITGTLTNPVQIMFNYDEAVLGNIDERTLMLHLSSDGNIWKLVVDSNRDADANIVYGTITHLSFVAPAGKSKITAATSDLTQVFVYPNPCYASRGQQLHFKRLTAQCTIKIFNIVGELVKEIEHNNGTDEEVWTNPGSIASGIYIYLITNNQGQKAIGKLGIIK